MKIMPGLKNGRALGVRQGTISADRDGRRRDAPTLYRTGRCVRSGHIIYFEWGCFINLWSGDLHTLFKWLSDCPIIYIVHIVIKMNNVNLMFNTK